MKINRIFSTGLAALLVCLCASAGLAEDDLWMTNFEAAKAKAKAEKKNLLVDFTGSDWCGFCIKLKKDVFDLEFFKKEAPKQFVLVELDYPHKEIPEDLKKQNEKLKKEYKVSGFPTICLMDADGQVVARLVGYRPGGPEKYLETLADFLKTWEGILKMKSELGGVQGIDRAKFLDRLIEAYDKLNNPVQELQTWSKEIINLDPGNQAGLKNKYECRIILADVEKLAAERKISEAVALLDKGLALEGLSNAQKQDLLFQQGMFQIQLKDFDAALAAMKKAFKADPENKKSSLIKSRIGILATIVDSQAKIAKEMETLETVEGLDRAKLLDEIIQANNKLQNFGAAKVAPAKIAEWTEEIVKLDSDDAAGLKNKYEFSKILNDAGKLVREKKFDEGIALIDKALAISGVTAEQTQEGLMAKGSNYLARKDYEKSRECFKKALESAPRSRRASMIKFHIMNIERQMKNAK
jgi:thioredoxin-related protein